MLQGKRILLIVAGGIAAFKALELIRRLRERGAAVRCILTEAGTRFVTPLSLQALSEDRVYTDMFSLTDESEMGHIQLSRDADLLVVVPSMSTPPPLTAMLYRKLLLVKSISPKRSSSFARPGEAKNVCGIVSDSSTLSVSQVISFLPFKRDLFPINHQ